jgi:AcrR family transcriptional regulator
MQYLSQRLAAQSASEREQQPLPRSVAGSQRDRLLDATETVIAERGSAAATIEAIVKEAGVSSVTFYEHFRNKEECFGAAFDRAVEALSAEVREAIDPEAPPSEQVHAGLTGLLGALDAEPARARLCFVEAQKGGPQLRDRYDAALDLVADTLDDPLAQGIVGGLAWLLRERLELGGGGSMRELLPEMSEVLQPPQLAHG